MSHTPRPRQDDGGPSPAESTAFDPELVLELDRVGRCWARRREDDAIRRERAVDLAVLKLCLWLDAGDAAEEPRPWFLDAVSDLLDAPTVAPSLVAAGGARELLADLRPLREWLQDLRARLGTQLTPARRHVLEVALAASVDETAAQALGMTPAEYCCAVARLVARVHALVSGRVPPPPARR